MKISRRQLLAAGAASVVAGVPVRVSPASQAAATPARPSQPAVLRRGRTSHPPNLTIRDYLIREARHITDNALSDLKTPADFKRRIPERRRRYMDMMGLADLAPAKDRPAVPFKVTGIVERPRFRIEKLHYESLPNLHVTANLYVPTGATGRRPAVLYLCGHAPKQKVHYQGHPRRFAELG